MLERTGALTWERVTGTANGSVATFGAGRQSARSRRDLRSDLEQPGNEGSLRRHVAPADTADLSLPDHRHHLVTGERAARGREPAEAQSRSDQALDAPMILLDDVVQVFHVAQPREAPQL